MRRVIFFVNHAYIIVALPLLQRASRQAHLLTRTLNQPRLQQTEPTAAAVAAIRGHVAEVLTYCVRAHGYRMRYFIILNNLAQKVRVSHVSR